MLRKKLSVLVTTTLVLSLSIFSQVFGATQGWDLVDSGKHLDYDGNSTYMSSVKAGVNTWEAYKSGVIREDSAFVIEDVYISDYTETSTTLGYTNGDEGVIKFNTYNFKNMTSAEKQKTATHEIGHALGLGHTWGSKDIMQQGILSITSLSSTDKASYDAAYKLY